MKWYYCNINEISDPERERAYLSMPPAKRARVDRLKNEDARVRSVCAHFAAMRLVTETLGIADPVISARESDAPFIENSTAFISIAHSDKYVACAVSDVPVGIDIEKIRDVSPALCARVCVDEELEYIAKGDTATRFFEIWTGKEAYFKMLGTGITDLKSVNVLALRRRIFTKNGYFIQIVEKC